MNKERERFRKKQEAKDVEFNCLQVKCDASQGEVTNAQKEIKQLKARLDHVKSKEKENLSNYEKTLSTLEKENEKVSNKYEEIRMEYEASKKKVDTIKCQITKYEQLIDSLNEQIVLYKRDVKENELNYNQLCQNYESEREANFKLNSKCQQLEQILHENHQSLAKFQGLEKTYSELELRHKRVESELEARTAELEKIKKKCEQSEVLIASQAQELAQTKEHVKSIETSSKLAQTELEDLRLKFQNSSVFIHHSCKTNSLLKSEKESLEKILQDNATKLKNLKDDYDKCYEKYVLIESEYNNMSAENDLSNKRLAEIKNLNEIITNEKLHAKNEATKLREELSKIQDSSKTLSRKLNNGIADKDTKISQLEQTLALYEKEVNLLKQSEYLLKTQEDSKSYEVATTIQAKLAQKNSKIESLKSKLNASEQSAESVGREKAQLLEEKDRLENEHITLLTKYEQQTREVKKLESDFFQIRSRMSNQELALEKAAIKYSESEKRNDALSENLLKFKNLISAIVYSNEATTPNNTKVQTASTDSIANQETTSNASMFTENLAKLIISKLKETNTIQVANAMGNNCKDNSKQEDNTTKESNEINVLDFFSGLQNQIELGKKSIQTSSTNLINLETSVDVGDKSTLMLNGK